MITISDKQNKQEDTITTIVEESKIMKLDNLSNDKTEFKDIHSTENGNEIFKYNIAYMFYYVYLYLSIYNCNDLFI